MPPFVQTESSPPPPARLLRLPEVIARVGLKRSAIYQRMSEGRFPRSRSLGPKCAVWVESEIDDWINGIALK
ncbi:MAG: AlpA family transcriptional regulator [Qipengyuania sp.]|nr:AlpA family transcriptional regulator [Qipengyuania sp.]